MKSDGTPLGPSQLLASAVKHAKELASKSGEPAVIYHRPIDESWFVRRADTVAPPGPTIKTTVYPDKPNPNYPDIPQHPLDGPSPTDVQLEREMTAK